MNRLESVVESSVFNRFITGVIVFAALLIGLETYQPLMERYVETFHLLNNLVLGVFVLEAALRFAATWPGVGRYFRSGWNIFDLVIIVLSLLPFSAAYAPVVRLIRLLRVLRLVRAVPELQVILGALLRSIPSMGYVLLLLMLFLYVYAVAGVFLFGPNDPVHFRDLHTALLTLFKTLTGEGWTDFLDAAFYGCQRFELPFPEQCTQPQAAPLLAVVYFVSYILLGTMIFLNLIVGIVVNSIDEVRKNQERKKASEQALEFNQIQEKLSEVQQMLQGFEDRWGRK
ncbi:MAG: ion transporter [Meiothermus sp.]|nr:ion transporter [Meiothermus sp.]